MQENCTQTFEIFLKSTVLIHLSVTYFKKQIFPHVFYETLLIYLPIYL